MERTKWPALQKKLEVVISPPKGNKPNPKNVGLVSVVYNEEAGQSLKRPRRESVDRQQQSVPNSGTRMLRKVARVLKGMTEEVKALSLLTKDNQNTKKEIKEKVSRLASDMSLLNTTDIKRILEEGIISGECGSKGEAEAAEEQQKEELKDEKIEELSGKVEAILRAIERIEGEGRRQQDGVETEEPAKRQRKQQKAGQEAQEEQTQKKTMAEVVKDRQGAESGKQANKKGEGSKDNEGWETKKSKSFRARPERILVETSGSTYADTLRRIKAGVGEKLGAGVKNVRRSQAGNLVVQMEKGTSGGEMVKAIQDVMGEACAKITRGSRIILEAKGVEEETSQEEVNEAAKKANPTGHYETKAIREYGNGLRIALIEANREDAATLLRIGYIKVGWSRVRIQEKKKKPIECMRCFGYGHMAAECKGEDRGDKCKRCNGNGHREKECKEEPVCTLCKDLGEATNHFRGSKGCRAFKEAQAAMESNSK